MKIAVSFLKTPYSKKETVKKIEETSADFLHVDLIDGKFVENKNFEIDETIELLKNTKKKLDIHLMTEDVEKYVEAFKVLSPEYITFHIEVGSILPTIKKIKEYNMKAGIAINPDTPIDVLLPYLNEIDLVLIMSVEPGKGGQSFLPKTIERLKELKDLQQANHFLITVDGGINNQTIKLVNNLADIAVSGSFICESENFEEQITKLRNN